MSKKLKQLTRMNNFTVVVWHKDGIIEDITGKENGRVYVNGKLANTKKKYQHVVITFDKN